MARSRVIIDRNLINLDIDESGKIPPAASKQEETEPFTQWNSNTNLWDNLKPDSVFNGNLNTSQFLNGFNSKLTETTSQIINQFSPETRNSFLSNGTFTRGIIGNGTTSNAPESGATGSGNPQAATTTTGAQSPSIGNPDIKHWRYPSNFSKEFDYLQITRHTYVASGFQSLDPNTPSAFLNKLNSAEKRLSAPNGSITLPMQPGLSESNSVNWGPDSLNVIQAAFGNTAAQTINTASSGNGFAAVTGLVDGIIQNLGDLANTEGLKDYLIQYFAGQSVGANFVTRNTGLVLNPNLELLFGGPNLRSFSYSYQLTPRDFTEANQIKNIILFLKRAMAPKKLEGNLFLKTPDVFKLKYIFGKTNKEHPFLNKIKPCALTSLNIDYTPDGSYMTYQDGSLTSYRISMVFSELEPIYDIDFVETDSSTMGY